jgi:hypothetical protein
MLNYHQYIYIVYNIFEFIKFIVSLRYKYINYILNKQIWKQKLDIMLV